MGCTISKHINEKIYNEYVKNGNLNDYAISLKAPFEFFEKWTIDDIKYASDQFKSSADLQQLRHQACTNDDKGQIIIPSQNLLYYYTASARCTWEEYNVVIQRVEDHRKFQIAEKRKESWHPCTKNYAFDPDQDEIQKWEEYQVLLKKIREKSIPASVYDDIYTSDENSSDSDLDEDFTGMKESEVSSMELNNNLNIDLIREKEVIKQEQLQESNTHITSHNSSLGSKTSESSVSISSVSSNETIVSLDISIDRNKNTPIVTYQASSPPLNSESQFSILLRPETSYKIPIPKSFDPELRSPIFFGYKNTKWTNSYLKEKEREKEFVSLEESIVERKTKEKRDRLTEHRCRCTKKKQCRDNKIKMVRERHKLDVMNHRKERKKIELSELPQEKRTSILKVMDKEYQSIIIANDMEIETLILNNEKSDEKEKMQTRFMESDLEIFMGNESGKKASCDCLYRKLRKEMRMLIISLEVETNIMDNEKQKLITIKEDIKMRRKIRYEQSDRSMLIFAEGRLEEATRRVANVLEDIEDQKLLIQRSFRRRQKQNRILPLFECISNENETISIIDLIVTMTFICNENAHKKMRYLVNLFDLNKDGFLFRNEFIYLLLCGSRALQTIGCFHSILERDQIFSIYVRATKEYNMSTSEGLTHYETLQYILKEISRHSATCTFFKIRTKSNTSDLQRKESNSIHLLEMGNISPYGLKHHFTYMLQIPRSKLLQQQKILVHQVALMMGTKDFTKSDYAKFRPKENISSSFSHIVPLDNGHLTNFTWYQKQAKLKAAQRLQSLFRGRNSRLIAEKLAKRQAFNDALSIALKEMRHKVEKEFKDREDKTGPEKMRWEATIRMKQAKLGSLRDAVDKKACVAYLLDETQKAREREIILRFNKLAIQRDLGFDGYKDSNCHKPIVRHTNAMTPPSNIHVKKKNREEYSILSNANMYKTDLVFVEFIRYLQQECKVMTSLKINNLLLELPSRDLIYQYIMHQDKQSSLEWDLRNHFRVLRDTNIVSDVLHNMLDSSIEFGLVKNLISHVSKCNNFVFSLFVEFKRSQRGKEMFELKQKEKIMKSSSKRTTKGEEHSQPLEQTQKEIQSYSLKVDNLKDEFIALRIKLDKAEIALAQKIYYYSFLSGQIIKNESPLHKKLLPYVDEDDWIGRYKFTVNIEEKDEEITKSKYMEIKNISDEFLSAASKYATIIIDELHKPWNKKTLFPHSRRSVDGRGSAGGRGRDSEKYHYFYRNIHFRVLVDDDGIFDGSDELAAKAGGHEIRGSKEYLKIGQEKVTIPLQALIDVHGFRVLAVSELPIMITKYDLEGNIKGITSNQVLGIVKVQKIVLNKDKSLDLKMKAFSNKLNLRRHFVKGEHDLTSKELYCSADIKGFKTNQSNYCLINFWRSFPSENPEESLHLHSSPRGMTIFSRMLRPEFVSKYKNKLSPDANCLIIHGVPDAGEHTNKNKAATKYLITCHLTLFAENLACMQLDENYSKGFGIDITELMHANGLNMRHLGLLRSKFWVKLKGTVNLIHKETKVQTNNNFTNQIRRGARMKINGEYYEISTNSKSVFTSSIMTLDQPYKGKSRNNQELYSGVISNDQNSRKLRLLLLAEMTARTIKNLLRSYLRNMSQNSNLNASDTLRINLVANFLNLTTGFHVKSQSFWCNQVYPGVRQRFGNCALLLIESSDLFHETRSMSVYIITRLSQMMLIEINNSSITSFIDKEGKHRFGISDIIKVGPRIKHNIFMKRVADAIISSLESKSTFFHNYQIRVQRDRPHLYWILGDRNGSRIVKNRGLLKCEGLGLYSRHVLYEQEGPFVKSQYSTYFSASKKCNVKLCVKTNAISFDTSQATTIEAWARVSGAPSKNRTLIMSGCYALVATRNEKWSFDIYSKDMKVTLEGPKLEYDKFQYLVGSCDGMICKFYVNGKKYSEKQLDSGLLQEENVFEKKMNVELTSIDEVERKASLECLKSLELKFQMKFKTKQGLRMLRDRVRILRSNKKKIENRVQIGGSFDENYHLDDSKEKLEKLAKEELLKEAYYREKKSITKQYLLERERIKKKIKGKKKYMRDLNSKSISVGSTTGTRKFSNGHYFFEGYICHVAVYLYSLRDDDIGMHWNIAKFNDCKSSFLKLASLADDNFKTVMKELPSDHVLLDKYLSHICRLLDMYTACDEYPLERIENLIDSLIEKDCKSALRKILKHLPKDLRFSKIVCKIYEGIISTTKIKTRISHKDLFFIPFKFGLTRTNIKESASIIRRSLEEDSLVTIYGRDLHWIPKLRNDSAVVSLMTNCFENNNYEVIELTEKNHCYDLNDIDLHWIVTNNICLRVLNISGCRNLTDTSITKITNFLSCLEILKVDNCYGLRGNCKFEEMKQMKYLKEFSSRGSYNIEDPFILWLLSGSHNLEMINLAECKLMTNDIVASIGRYLKSITSMKISSCPHISDLGISSFILHEHAKNVVSLDLSMCTNISDQGLVELSALINLRLVLCCVSYLRIFFFLVLC